MVVTERIDFRGQSWMVADASYDDSGMAVGSHWHLTLTDPQPVGTEPEGRKRVGRSAKKDRATTSGLTWERPEAVPGAVLSADAQRRLQEKLRDIDEAQRRGAAGARNYVIG